jgi:protein-L-isoaspartate(D-aspartate) O-methyltransferase
MDTRETMIQSGLVSRGISDERVLEAFRIVAREEFVSSEHAALAYEDMPLPIGVGQTISQPYVVALTAEALDLKSDERVLEIGCGSGYAAAILSTLVQEVFTVERIQILADQARERLSRLGYDNVKVHCGDGTLGWPLHAPYDAIAVAACAPTVPKALLAQLAPQGRMVIPVGLDPSQQLLMRIVREDREVFREEILCPVRFVPLIGEQGVPE